MLHSLSLALQDDFRGFLQSLAPLALVAVVFAGLAWRVKGRAALADARAALGEARINLTLSMVGQLTIAPLITLFVLGLIAALQARGLILPTARLWPRIGQWPTLIAAVVAGDFLGYWRHRAQHLPWLWPAHAIHHSDTRLHWLSLERMHPIDQFGSALDTVILGALGFPFWALAGNVFVRHYWGYLIHADLPWDLGVAGRLLNTPIMHRWHHARDVEGSGHNFATVFSVWDRLFGTLHAPGPCDVPLGVREDMGHGVVGLYLHPLRSAWRAIRPAATRAQENPA